MNNKWIWNRWIFFGLIVTGITSCQKDHAEPMVQKYDMLYQVKINGDSAVKYVKLHTYTYYPEERRVWIIRSNISKKLIR
jgi:hypothetical protein